MSDEAAAEATGESDGESPDEPTAEADSIDAEAHESQEYRALAENNEYGRDNSSGHNAENEGEVSQWSISSEGYHNDEEYNESNVVDIREARARFSGKSGNDVSDTVESEGSEELDSLEAILEKNTEEHSESFIDRQHSYWKEAWNIFKGFTEVGNNEDVYEKIDRIASNGKPILVLMPGLGSFPVTGDKVDQYSGFNTVRISRDGPDVVHKVLSYVMEKTRVGAIVVGYSDGEKDFVKYLKQYGDEGLVSTFYGTASDKGKVEKLMDPSRVFYIQGQNDNLAPGFDKLLGRYSVGYGAQTSRPIFEVPNATHSSLVINPVDSTNMGKIIAQTAKAKYFNYEVKKAA
jgi:hypothetical protein